MTKGWMVIAVTLVCSVTAFSYPGGISGRTQKNTAAGCGGSGCHSGGPTPGVTVAISGPDTVVVGQTASYTVTVTGTTGTKGGVDIAAFSGTLAPVSSTLKLLNGDVVHKQRASSPFTYAFNYTAPAIAGTDTLFSTGKDNVFAGWNWSPKKPLTIISTTGVGDIGGISPSSFQLFQNYPNPFNPLTSIGYRLQRAGFVQLTVYDAAGREVATLVNGNVGAGDHAVSFDAGRLASGVYIYRLEVEGTLAGAHKMVLMK
jgi:hypothetical protein